ncbi:hypothetical protein Poly41_43590 [Novipirellula artificiosorum]|uniref:Uncharacterized protein n=1 Tax=Novipirellula artificiosorum TaxID=2528016 RepID=A0A5C6DAM4_9BACT|nr:hypothetical protein Poly41_43590 [Novipirellula artificiosorum]
MSANMLGRKGMALGLGQDSIHQAGDLYNKEPGNTQRFRGKE